MGIKKLLPYLVPATGNGDLRKAALLSLTGAIVAGGFGIVHDQITYTISPEYFTRMKFDQFRAVDFGLPPRVFVAQIGFLATWWVGLIATWFLARIALPGFESPERRVMKAVAVIVAITTAAGACGFFLGPVLLENRKGWPEALQEMGVTDNTAFLQVAGVHLGSYAGAFAGWILVTIGFLRMKRDLASQPSISTM
ncbi:MAG: hypothetical protein EOP85_18030 [Verrucomicrobiaceae bacterium]|nr:MAG: hypothetical protein EOP85_18030 [Verrucomicrobiaceae bacterium]